MNRSRAALPGLLEVPFRFEGLGSQIVFYQEETPMHRDVSWSDERHTVGLLSDRLRSERWHERAISQTLRPSRSLRGAGHPAALVVLSDRPKPMARSRSPTIH